MTRRGGGSAESIHKIAAALVIAAGLGAFVQPVHAEPRLSVGGGIIPVGLRHYGGTLEEASDWKMDLGTRNAGAALFLDVRLNGNLSAGLATHLHIPDGGGESRWPRLVELNLGPALYLHFPLGQRVEFLVGAEGHLAFMRYDRREDPGRPEWRPQRLRIYNGWGIGGASVLGVSLLLPDTRWSVGIRHRASLGSTGDPDNADAGPDIHILNIGDFLLTVHRAF